MRATLVALALALAQAAVAQPNTAGPADPKLIAIYLELGAKLQAQAMALGGKIEYLDPEEGKKIEARRDYIRSWELWKRKAMGR